MKLSSPDEIRRAIARVVNMVLNNEISPKAANTILYACNSALASIRTDEYGKKVEELEAVLEEREMQE